MMALSRYTLIAACSIALIASTFGCQAQQKEDEWPGGGVPQEQQQGTDFQRWSGDDNQIDKGEFQNALVSDQLGIYKGWDQNNNRSISLQEFNRAVFDILDEDQDNTLTQQEWQAHQAWYRKGQQHGTFEDWDQNNNAHISSDEAAQKISNLFGLWDHDDSGTLTSSEFAEHAFVVWDTGNDGTIDQDEWNEHVDTWTRAARRPAS